MDNFYLYHHGVKGMKWGVRKKRESNEQGVKKKKHLGIDDRGSLNLIDHPTTKQGIRNFAIRSSISAGFLSASVYMSKHPEVVVKGMSAVTRILSKIGGTRV